MSKLNQKLDYLYVELDGMLMCYEDTGHDAYLREALRIKEEIKALSTLTNSKVEDRLCV